MKIRIDEFLGKANHIVGSLAGISFGIAVFVGGIVVTKRYLKELHSSKKETKLEEVKPAPKKKTSSKTTTKAVDCNSETK